jgi:DNA-binding NarL/FixJ family response regulator
VKQEPAWTAMGWLLVDPAVLPQAWQDRAIPMALVPLLPEELADHLSPTHRTPLSRQEASLLELVVRGLSKQRMARELNISLRTLDRRLRALREHFAVHSLTELAAAGARRGFGTSSAKQPPPDGPVCQGGESAR